VLVNRRTFVPKRKLAHRPQLSWAIPFVATSLSAPSFAADLPPAPASVFTWTGVYLGANVGAWFAPNNPKYEALGFPSPGFDLVPNVTVSAVVAWLTSSWLLSRRNLDKLAFPIPLPAPGGEPAAGEFLGAERRPW
jgi:hypothetical protein